MKYYIEEELIDVSEIKCDFMSFNGSKWLCGPMGTGLFYCNRKSSELLDICMISSFSSIVYSSAITLNASG